MNTNEVKVLIPKSEYDRLLKLEEELNTLIDSNAKGVIHLYRIPCTSYHNLVIFEESIVFDTIKEQLDHAREELKRMEAIRWREINESKPKKWWQ